MDWEGKRQSDNVEDRRGQGRSGGGGGIRIGGAGIGIGTIVIALLASFIFGINPMSVISVLGGLGGGQTEVSQPAPRTAPAAEGPTNAQQDRDMAFVRTVLADTEDVWKRVFPGRGGYRVPGLVVFSGATRTACGVGQTAMGPFYCPQDGKVYLDTQFFGTLARRMGAPGEFAQAYVIAHEVGHHVQNLLGITGKVDSLRGRLPEVEMNQLSVRVELQADCLAGVWAKSSQQGQQWIHAEDIEQAINAAAQIGDDTLQRRSQGMVVPDAFTHGSSRQRVEWFTRGFQSGQPGVCDTFGGQI